MTRNRCLERAGGGRGGGRGKSRGNNSCHFSDQYFPSFLRKHSTVLSQNKNGIIQHKN